MNQCLSYKSNHDSTVIFKAGDQRFSTLLHLHTGTIHALVFGKHCQKAFKIIFKIAFSTFIVTISSAPCFFL